MNRNIREGQNAEAGQPLLGEVIDGKITNHTIVRKMIGDIEPVGETRMDDIKYERLGQTIDLVNELLDDIIEVARYYDRQEYSMSRAGERARNFLKATGDELVDYFA